MAVRIQEVRVRGVSLLFTSSNSAIIFHTVQGPALLWEEKEKIPAEGLAVGGGGGPLFTLGLVKGWPPSFLTAFSGFVDSCP